MENDKAARWVDRLDVIDVCVKMHWHLDRRDWSAFADVFADEVEMPTHQEVQAKIRPASRPRQQIVDGLKALTEGLITQHIQSAQQVEIEGDRAVCIAQAISVHTPGLDHGSPVLVNANLYRFMLTRGQMGWKITGFTADRLWQQGDPEVQCNAARQSELVNRSIKP
jgi:hypothetical protein